MFFFGKSSKTKKLRAQYKKKMEESFKMSKIDRKASDKLMMEAEEIMQKLKKEEAKDK